MVDEMFDRHYQLGRNEMNAALAGGLGRLRKAIDDAFEVLVGIEYQTPWTTRTRNARSH